MARRPSEILPLRPPHRSLKLTLQAKLKSPFFLKLRTVQRLFDWDIYLEEKLISTYRTDLRMKPNAERGV